MTSPTRRSRWVARVAIGLASLICVGTLATMAANAIGTQRGYETMSMATGSMAPKIAVGDLVISHRVSPNSIKVGDVITFREPIGSHLIFSHRVYKILPSDSGPEFTTKGDNNKAADPWTIHYVGPAWKVTTVIPFVGHLLAWTKSFAGRMATWVSLFALVLALLWPVIVNDRPTETNTVTAGRAA